MADEHLGTRARRHYLPGGAAGDPTQLCEAAAIDGADASQSLRRVTVPLLTPTIFFNLILELIGTFQTFTSAYVVSNGGPLNSTLFFVLYLYRKAFQHFQMGYASALAWVLSLHHPRADNVGGTLRAMVGLL